MRKEFIRIKVADLIPYERNPRKIPQEAIEDVRESIRQCGQLNPIEIDENNVILAGHTRRLAYLSEGVEEVDAVRYYGLTEEQKRKYRILSNKTAEKSGWDFELLDEELQELDFDGYDFGLEICDEDIFADVDDLNESNYDAPTKKELICPACGHRDSKERFRVVSSEDIPEQSGE